MVLAIIKITHAKVLVLIKIKLVKILAIIKITIVKVRNGTGCTTNFNYYLYLCACN